MQLKVGSRWRSAVCATEVIVVRAASGEVELACGGYPMVAKDSSDAPAAEAPTADWSSGTLMGKRYADEEAGIEVLVTKPGAGSLSLNGSELPIKEAKPLPASD